MTIVAVGWLGQYAPGIRALDVSDALLWCRCASTTATQTKLPVTDCQVGGWESMPQEPGSGRKAQALLSFTRAVTGMESCPTSERATRQEPGEKSSMPRGLFQKKRKHLIDFPIGALDKRKMLFCSKCANRARAMATDSSARSGRNDERV
jgi:hypothetical protein